MDANKTVTVKDNRWLRELIGAVTMAPLLTYREFDQIVITVRSALERVDKIYHFSEGPAE